MVTSVVVIALTGLAAQGHDKEEIDGYRKRRIYEAVKCAEMWSYWQTERLYPTLVMRGYRGERLALLEFDKAHCRPDLLAAAHVQICDAYKINGKQLRAIMENPFKIRQFPFSPDIEPTVKGDEADYLQAWEKKGTLFNPDKVRLSPKLAKRYGYENPRRPPAPRKPPTDTKTIPEHHPDLPPAPSG